MKQADIRKLSRGMTLLGLRDHKVARVVPIVEFVNLGITRAPSR
jgi:hypothetical protein